VDLCGSVQKKMEDRIAASKKKVENYCMKALLFIENLSNPLFLIGLIQIEFLLLMVIF